MKRSLQYLMVVYLLTLAAVRGTGRSELLFAQTAATRPASAPTERLDEVNAAYRRWWYAGSPFPNEPARQDLRAAVEGNKADAAALFWLSRDMVREIDHPTPQQISRVRELTRRAADMGLDVAIVHDSWDRASNLSSPAPEARAILRTRVEEALKRGEPNAARFLGKALRTGGPFGGTADLPKAEGLLQRAAELGDNRANAELARAQLDMKRPGDALSSLSRGAEGGDTEAMVMLGQWLRDGTAGVVDAGTAETWLRKAASSGHPGGQLELARTILSDTHRWQSDTEPLQLLEQAAPALDSAKLLLAHGHLYGLSGAAPDPQKAESLLTELAERGNLDACEWLGNALLTGLCGHQDVPAAKRYLKQAADGGDQDAWGLLNLYQHLEQRGMAPPSSQPGERKGARKGEISE
jgi:TPR repeat protein